MLEIIVEVEGMACGMCESHINDAIRRAFPVKKVSSSRSKGQTVILSQQPLDEDALKSVIAQAGYQPGNVTVRPYQRKGFPLFG